MGGMACCGTSLDRKDPKKSFLENSNNISVISHRSNISRRTVKGAGGVDPASAKKSSGKQ